MVHGICLGNNRLKRQKFPGGPVVRTPALSLLGAQVPIPDQSRSCKSNGSRDGVGEEKGRSALKKDMAMREEGKMQERSREGRLVQRPPSWGDGAVLEERAINILAVRSQKGPHENYG